jgi:hypothetical protein
MRSVTQDIRSNQSFQIILEREVFKVKSCEDYNDYAYLLFSTIIQMSTAIYYIRFRIDRFQAIYLQYFEIDDPIKICNHL